MKLARIPEIDLAKAMTVAPGQALEAHMIGFNSGMGRWSYEPTRNRITDLLGAVSPLVGSVERPTWESLERTIRSSCKRGPDEVAGNLPVSKLLFDAVKERGWRAVQEPMARLPIGLGGVVRYWSEVVIADHSGPFIPFFDHRRSGGLEKADARRVVFSMQHIGVRDRNPDLSDARLAIIRFPADGDERRLDVHFHDESDLLSYEHLADRVQIVYKTWARVSEDRAGKKRASGGGDSNPFNF